MRIQFKPEVGLAVIVAPDEPTTILRTLECLIQEFGEDCDVSFLRECLENAKIEYNHTIQ